VLLSKKIATKDSVYIILGESKKEGVAVLLKKKRAYVTTASSGNHRVEKWQSRTSPMVHRKLGAWRKNNPEL